MKLSMMYKAAVLFVLCFITVFSMTKVSFAEEKENMQEFAVMEKVYAFASPVNLLESIDVLLENKKQVIIGIMPIYENTDYPAMAEFTNVICYAQSKGCRILLHFPIIQKNDVSSEEVIDIINSQISMYEGFGINIRGVLMGEDDKRYSYMENDINNYLPVFKVSADDLEYYDKELKKSFTILNTSNLPEVFYNYTQRDIPEDFDFKRDALSRAKVSLESQNRVLMVVVTVGITAFLVMILLARRQMRKYFFNEEDGKDERY